MPSTAKRLATRFVNPQDVGRRLFDWMVSDGRGIGGLTALVLRFPGYLADPQTAARTVWEATGHNSAPNGAVMRTSVLGVWNCLSQKQVARNAEQGCLVTHADPRCVASCVAVSLAIRTAVMGQADVEAAVDEAGARAAEYDSEARSVVESSSRDLALMKLDEGLNAGEANRIGYTYKTVGAGFWAFRTASSFIQGISDVITQGGDTDTNAAVAGAMMGARLGLSGIPARLVEGLADRTLLEQKIQALLAAVEPQLLTDR
ncbi:MAG: ADP-ribosylglycohydrolase family protein [candidate division WOR-3 bacterium]|nr:ADP-ribosylglycohydrolase family protein [candidate division WOR-3 bacterium]